MGSVTLNSPFEGSPDQQREDEPICFFVSTFIPNEKGGKEGVHHCKCYTLQSDQEDTVSVEGREDGESPISIEIKKQRLIPEKRAKRYIRNVVFKSPIFLNQIQKRRYQKRRARWGKRANYRLRELQGLPSTLPYTVDVLYSSMFSFKSRIFFMDEQCMTDVHCLDIRFPEEGWKKIAKTPSIDCFLTAVAYSDKIYALGKDIKDYPFLGVLDLGSDHWRGLAKLPSSLKKISDVVAVGGLDLGSKILFYSYNSEQLFYYNIERNSWSIIAHCFGSWHGRLVLALGCVFCLAVYSWGSDLCAYDLATRSWLPVKGLHWDDHIMPRRDPSMYSDPCMLSANLFQVNHNKLAFIWTRGEKEIHFSKFFIHKTPTCIRAHPSFCLTADIRSPKLPTFVPLNGSCFGLPDVDYYEEEEGRRELTLEGKEKVVPRQGNCFDLPVSEKNYKRKMKKLMGQ